MFNIVLWEPEIPANTGNIGRTCVLTGTRLHLIEPLGFSLDDHAVQRAGLGYWPNLDVTVYRSWEDFLARTGLGDELPGSVSNADHTRPSLSDRPHLHLLTKKARHTYTEATYRDGDYLVFGKESNGIPEEVLASHPACCERIPMLTDERALPNRDTWAKPAHGNTEHAALSRQDICGNFIDPDDYRISALNLSNAAAIVLYEALRQTGFAGLNF